MSRLTVAWVTVEALLDERFDDLALAADRPEATSSRIARWRSRACGSWPRRHGVSVAGGHAAPTGARRR